MEIALALGAGGIASWILHDYLLPQHVTNINQGISTVALIEGIAVAGIAIMVYQRWA